MDLPDCPPGAEGYEDTVVEVAKKPITEEPLCTKAEQDFQTHLNSLRIKVENGETRPMVERHGRDVSGKWIYLCYPCAAVCSGEIVLQTHISGKKHKNKLSLKMEWPLSIFEEHPYILSKQGIRNGEKGEATDIVLQKMAQEVSLHNNSAEQEDKYQNLKNIRCYIQDILDEIKTPLLGVEYLLEHPPEEEHHEPAYICTLCQKQGHPRTIVNHLTCTGHRTRYLSRHFPTANRILWPYLTMSRYREAVFAVVNRLAILIEDKYGRLKPTLIKKELYEKEKEFIHQWIAKSHHFSEKDGPSFSEVVDIDLLETLRRANESSPNLKSGSEKRNPSPPVVSAPSKPSRGSGRPDGRSDSGNKYSVSIENERRRDDRYYRNSQKYGKSKYDSHSSRYEPYHKRHEPPPDNEPDKKTANYTYKLNVVSHSILTAQEAAKKMLHYHEKNPEKHPLYPEEWKKFWNRRYKEIQNEGKDASKHDYKPEWIVFWTARMKELHDEELRIRVDEIYRRMKVSPPKQSSSPTKASPTKDQSSSNRQSPVSRRSPSRRSPGSRRSPHMLRSPLPRRHRSPYEWRGYADRRRSPNYHPSKRRSPDYHPKRRSPGRWLLDRRSPDHRSLNRRSSDHRSLDRRSPDHRTLDRRSPDHQPLDRRSPDHRSLVRRSPDHQPLDRRSHDCHSQERRSQERRSQDHMLKRPDDRYRKDSGLPGRLGERVPSPRSSSSRIRSRSPLGGGKASGSGSPLSRRGAAAGARNRSPLPPPCEQTVLISDEELHHEDIISPVGSENELESLGSLPEVRSPTYGRPAAPGALGPPEHVLATLRLLVALEDHLGSIGPKLVQLLAEALTMEKEKPNSSEELLVRDSAVVLIETAKEKLKGAVQAGLVPLPAVAAVRAAIVRAASTLHEADTRAKKLNKIASKKEVVPVAGVGEVDRAQIAQQMAAALIAQGKTDVSSEELAQLVDAVVGMAEAKKKESAAAKQQETVSEAPKASALQMLQSAYNENDKKVEKETFDAMDGLSDSDLETLMKNFNELSAEEQHSLIAYLKKLEARSPQRVEKLRQYVMAATAHSATPPTLHIDSDDDDDYTVEEVFQSATQKVKENQMLQEMEIVKKSIEESNAPTTTPKDNTATELLKNLTSATDLLALVQASIQSTAQVSASTVTSNTHLRSFGDLPGPISQADFIQPVIPPIAPLFNQQTFTQTQGSPQQYGSSWNDQNSQDGRGLRAFQTNQDNYQDKGGRMSENRGPLMPDIREQFISDDSGQFFPDNRGQYTSDNRGQFISENSGQFVPENTGQLDQEDTGQYIPENMGPLLHHRIDRQDNNQMESQNYDRDNRDQLMQNMRNSRNNPPNQNNFNQLQGNRGGYPGNRGHLFNHNRGGMQDNNRGGRYNTTNAPPSRGYNSGPNKNNPRSNFKNRMQDNPRNNNFRGRGGRGQFGRGRGRGRGFY